MLAAAPPLAAIRWASVAVGLALAGPALGAGELVTITAAVALVGVAALGTLRPEHEDQGETVLLLRTVAETGVALSAVVATGHWESPFVFSLIACVVTAGLSAGMARAIRVALTTIVAVALPYLLTTEAEPEEFVRLTGQWATLLVLVAGAAGYARRLSREAEERHSLALDRLGRLAQANTLLYSLHQVAQALPASLDLGEVLDSTVARLRTFYDLSALAVILADDTSDNWLVARQEGARLPAVLEPGELPITLRFATVSATTVVHEVLGASRNECVAERSRSGLYAPLRARGQLVGLLAAESTEGAHFSRMDVEVLDRFTEPAALAIDNARWFSRLRSVGADEERTRIARELHDSVGQSLAYLSFEMDRLVTHSPDDQLRSGLESLRRDLVKVLGEVRDTLYDLRTDVSEEAGLGDTVQAFLERVRTRASVEVRFSAEGDGRLPLRQEREMWRIAQEAVTNAERHAAATEIVVTWRCDGVQATLEVADDGRGFDPRKAGRVDSYGLVGMRERAAGIGATLSVDATPRHGTSVRCSLVPAERRSG